MPDLEPTLRIDSIAFSERGVELSFMEARDETPYVAMVKTLLISPDCLDEETQEVMEALEAYLDAALTLMRNPPERKPASARR